MKTIRLVFAAIICFVVFLLPAQNIDLNQKLPIDPKVKIGKLDNGLTYYIQANQSPEKRVVFYLAVNAGSILETEDQVGLAHFTEHMGFNGTEQFPGNSLIDQLEKKGIVFGRELNAYTDFDETVYRVMLPTEDEELFNMGLKILDGWAFGMLMTEEEIDKERGVIIEEWRVYSGADDDKLLEKTLPVELKGSQYAHRLPIGTLENIQQFKYSSIRSFYKTWYRPDNIAIIIVGDFDPVKIENMVIDYFNKYDKPTTPLNRPDYPIPENKEPLIAIAADPEATKTAISLNFKQVHVKTETIGDFRRNLTYSLFSTMFNLRISEIGENKAAPFLHGYAQYSNYWSRTTDAFQLYFRTKENKGLQAFELVLTEIKRLQQHGFVQTELERAKKKLLNGYESSAKGESKSETINIASRYGKHFLENYPILSLTDRYELAKILMDGISLEEINKIINQWVTDDNITVNFTMPEKKGMKIPVEKDFLSLFEKAKKVKTTPYIDNVSSLSFLAKEPKDGKVEKRTDNEKFDYTELILSNGAKVIIKSTDFKNNHIIFRASSKGGTSVYPDDRLLNAEYASWVIEESGIGNYNPTELKKFMAEKQLITLLTISPLREKIDGGTSVFCFETFLQYVYMVFEAPRKDKNVFDKEIDSWKSEVNMEKNSIDYQFSIFSHYLKYPNDKRTIVELEKKHIEMMNLDEMYDIFRERFSNGSDFIFYFVGNIDMEEHIPLIEKYIGGISSTEKKEEWIDRSQEFAKGVVDKTLCVGIGKKSQVDITTEMPFDRNDKDELCITILNHIVDIKLTENIREKLSGTYGVFFRLRVLKEPKSMVSMNIFFGCEPKRTDELTHAIWNVLDEIIKNGPTETDLDKAKTQLCSRREVAVRENNSWIRWFEQLYDYDNKLLTLDEYKEQINALTVEDIKKVAKYLQHDEYVRAVLLPKRMKKKNDRMKN